MQAPKFRNLTLIYGWQGPNITSDSLPNWTVRALVHLGHGVGTMGLSLGLKHCIMGTMGWEPSLLQICETPQGTEPQTKSPRNTHHPLWVPGAISLDSL